MNIIYLITNTYNEQHGIYPCYYIGSKKNYKGPGTYWGTSKHPKMINELSQNPEHFSLTILEEVPNPLDLIKAERMHQNKVLAASNHQYYNITYAGRTTIGHRWMTNGATDISVSPEKVNEFISMGFEFGISKRKGNIPWNKGIKATPERKANMSKGRSGIEAWNKGKQMSYDFSKKSMTRPYLATHVDTGTETEIRTVADNIDMCNLVGRQYQTIRYHMNRRNDDYTPAPINGYIFRWI